MPSLIPKLMSRAILGLVTMLLPFASQKLMASSFNLYEITDPAPPEDGEVESEFLELPSDPDENELPAQKVNGIGFGVGEVVPQEKFSIHGFHRLDERAQLGISIGIADYKTTELESEENVFVHKARVVVLDSAYYYRPKPTFPFVVSGGIGLTATAGHTVATRESVNGSYKLYGGAIGAGLGMIHGFDKGLWIHWQILSLRYGHILKTAFSGLDNQQKNLVMENANKLKISGIFNIVLGYAM
jgi:hypothetical protein